ncbi:EAP30/Vps36 family-domain-containing protein [Catenaria anguillulae PL171]|uniref:EAP30/Vps36 family-domain-containing protein n=1 Tax=Catenaria anguillulae PL171 TaxID=765915 RepID=A0A1Y2I1G1_9FUNG|nr:EAP30/Vps36 family-domain-containing protein [Catenaria anguillulae PL171]
MRRNVGIAGLQRAAREREQFKDMGDRLAAQQLEQLKTQMATFKSSLEEFAAKYRKDIAKNPAFRLKFQQMCATSVSILLLQRIWGDVLGNLNDYYYDLSIRIMEVCLALRDAMGPLIPLHVLFTHLNQTAVDVDLCEDDIHRAIGLLGPLGGGYELVRLAGSSTPVVVTVPRELNPDFIIAAQRLQAQAPAGCTAEEVASGLDWTRDRAHLCLDLLVTEGIAWVDQPSPSSDVRYFWFSADILFGAM